MSRRADPESIHAAHRAAMLQRLILDGEMPDRAEAWIARWEAVADVEGRSPDGAYWDAAWDWIAARRHP